MHSRQPRSPGKPLRVQTIIGNPLLSGGVSYTVTELLDNLQGPDLQPKLHCTSADPRVARTYHAPLFNWFSYRMVCKAKVPTAWQNKLFHLRALADIRQGDIVYVWPPYDTQLIKRAKDKRAIVVSERINCMSRTCKTVLERAFGRLDRALPIGWCTPEGIREEEEQMQMCDWVTAPSPMVTQSLIEAGIPAERILETSYGWSPKRLPPQPRQESTSPRVPVFLFVGLGIVRKGLDLLLEYWEKADVRGVLHIAGNIDDDIRSRCKRQLARPDVKELGYVTDVASMYGAADVFVLPTHEEGGPQVTYEAVGCGLPCLVSPMGAGRVVRHGLEGYLIDPLDETAWVNALRTLSKDPVLRRSLGQASLERATEYTWAKAGAKLSEHFRRLY